MSGWLIVIAAVIPLVLLHQDKNYGPFSQVVDVLSTFFHELGHALASSLTQQRVSHLEVVKGKRWTTPEGTYMRSASGVTVYERSDSRLARFFVTLSGYAGPPTLGLVGLVTMALVPLEVWSGVWLALMLLLFIAARGAVSYAVILGSAAFLGAPILLGTAFPESAIAQDFGYMIPVAFFFSVMALGVRAAAASRRADLRAQREGRYSRSSAELDTEKLWSMTGIRPSAWSAFFVGYSALALIAGLPVLLCLI